jgi:hypothetical protein
MHSSDPVTSRINEMENMDGHVRVFLLLLLRESMNGKISNTLMMDSCER